MPDTARAVNMAGVSLRLGLLACEIIGGALQRDGQVRASSCENESPC